MNCPKCSYKLTLLFTGTACDKCDGLLKQETAPGLLKPGARVRFIWDGKHTEYVGTVASQHNYEIWNVVWDHAPKCSTQNTSDELLPE